MKRLVAIGLLSSFVLVGCGEAGLLDGIGDATRQYVQGDATTTTTIVAVAAGTGDEGLIGATDVQWFNDDLPNQMAGTSEEVVSGVWQRELNSRFVQSSRSEIALALPSVMFPDLVPETVRWITSQLVFDEATGALDADTTAAFGLWISDPYQSDAARLGVLRVGEAAADLLAVRSEIVPIIVPDGISLGGSLLRRGTLRGATGRTAALAVVGRKAKWSASAASSRLPSTVCRLPFPYARFLLGCVHAPR